MTIETRVQRLHREIEARYGDGDLVFVSVVCNGCGKIAEAESVLKLLPLVDDWTIGEWGGSDYCAECRPRR